MAEILADGLFIAVVAALVATIWYLLIRNDAPPGPNGNGHDEL